MKKLEYMEKLDKLNLDKNRYCIISDGVLLMYGLKEETEDIDIKVTPSYFEELKDRFQFKKSSKFPYLYELSDIVEVAVLDFDSKDIEWLDGYPLESLELQLKWKLSQNREKDQKDIVNIKRYLSKKK